MGHYDSCYDYEAEKTLKERSEAKDKLKQQVAKLQRLILDNKYRQPVPQRFQDSLEDFANYLK